MKSKYSALLLSTLLAACAQAPLPIVSNITNTPDLSAYKNLSITSNSTTERIVYTTEFFSDNSTLVAKSKEGLISHLPIQPNQCRNSSEPGCERRFAIVGELSLNKDTRLNCFIELRNDVNEGYYGQAIQGLCRDRYSRNFTATISK